MSDETGPRRRASLTPAGSPSLSPAWSEVTDLGARSYRIRLGGFFGPAWMANLCKGIAEHRLSIDRAHAMRARNQSWMAELVVIALEGASDPRELPYLEVAESMEMSRGAPLKLARYELVETADHGGTLRLELEADDTLGLLGALLARLADLQLYPVELHIETKNRRAHDCLWLGTLGLGGKPPTHEVKQELDRLLSAALRG
jgi:UTP:GlnB (protein PII) uridylyltransferase